MKSDIKTLGCASLAYFFILCKPILAYCYSKLHNKYNHLHSTAVFKCHARNAGLVVVSDCTCSSFNVIYECTTIGPGSTLWVLGSSAECGINLRHSLFMSQTAVGRCMNGAVEGRGLQVEGDAYVSQLNVPVRTNLNGTIVQCEHDDGGSLTVIGTSTLTLTRQGE